MKRGNIAIGIGALCLLGACVTINVYFPAAAAEKAADRIIEEVWGPDAQKPPPPATQGALPGASRVLARLLSVVVPSAHEQQANLEIATPAINRIKNSMKARHEQLVPFYANGAVGLTGRGLVAVRDAKVLTLAERPKANKLVAAENQDRNALYRAIASANGHPEWEADIRSTFARRWIDKARSGWWYQSGGAWKQR